MPITNDIAFTKPFSLTTDIVFAPDVPAQNATLEVVLPKPTIAIQLSNVSSVVLTHTLQKPTIAIQLSRVLGVSASITLSKPIVSCFVHYDNNVWRGVESVVDSSFSESNRVIPSEIEASYSGTSQLRHSNESLWKNAQSLLQSINIDIEQAIKLYSNKQGKYSEAKSQKSSIDSSFVQMTKINKGNDVVWSEAERISGDINSSSDQCLNINTTTKSAWRESQSANVFWDGSCSTSTPLNKSFDVLYDEAKKMPGAFWSRNIVIPPDPITDIRTTNIAFGDVLFLITSNIAFGIKTPHNKIINKRLYYMLNSFYLRRVSDSAEIQISSMNATLSQSEYTWGFDFTVIGTNSYNKLVEYEPMELELMVNRMEVEDTANRYQKVE